MKFKESGISDTLHRFWKKEHDWGWKKFMELSKLHDGFVIEDVLTIKAQVQVIRYLFSVVIWHLPLWITPPKGWTLVLHQLFLELRVYLYFA